MQQAYPSREKASSPTEYLAAERTAYCQWVSAVSFIWCTVCRVAVTRLECPGYRLQPLLLGCHLDPFRLRGQAELTIGPYQQLWDTL